MLTVLMVGMAAALVFTHLASLGSLVLPGVVQAAVGVAAGFGIGVVAAIMGVAGGELLIPTIVLLYGIDIKTAGAWRCWCRCRRCWSRSPATAVTATFAVLRANLRFVVVMIVGSIIGAAVGGLLSGVIPGLVLIPILAVLLVISAIKLARHD